MKTTGITRPIDEMGRIVLPKEIRRSFKLEARDMLEIFVEDNCIILKKTEGACIMCGAEEQLEKIDGKYICRKCMSKVASAEANIQQNKI